VNTTRLRNHCCKDPDAVRDVGRREQALGHAQRRRARNGKPLAACTMSSSLRDAIKNAERVERDFRASVDAQVWAYDMAWCHLCVHRRLHFFLSFFIGLAHVLHGQVEQHRQRQAAGPTGDALLVCTPMPRALLRDAPLSWHAQHGEPHYSVRAAS
jgi:hypothetical protein